MTMESYLLHPRLRQVQILEPGEQQYKYLKEEVSLLWEGKEGKGRGCGRFVIGELFSLQKSTHPHLDQSIIAAFVQLSEDFRQFPAKIIYKRVPSEGVLNDDELRHLSNGGSVFHCSPLLEEILQRWVKAERRRY